MNRAIFILHASVFLGLCQMAGVSHGANGGADANVPFLWPSLGGNFQRTGLSLLAGPTSGCLRWSFATDAPVQTGVALDTRGHVYMACMDGKLYCLSASGSVDWVYDANSPLTAGPTIAPDGVLLVGSESGVLHAVDLSGVKRWTYPTEGPIHSSPGILADGTVVFGSGDGSAYALHPGGRVMWKHRFVSAGVIAPAIFASPAVADDGTVYIGTVRNPVLYALNPADGNVKWACSFPRGIGLFASPVVGSGGIIYQTLVRDDHLYAVDPKDGAIAWALDLADPATGWYQPECAGPSPDCSDEDGWSEPVLGPDGTIYVSLDDPYLRAVNPNGTIKWGIRLGDAGTFTLTVSKDGIVYAACDSGHLYVVDPAGQLIARLATDQWLSRPVIGPDRTILLTDPTDRGLCTQACNHLLVVGPGILEPSL